MKFKSPVLAAALAAAVFAAPAPAMPTAVERGGAVQGVVVQGGLRFQKQIVLDRALLGDGGALLGKGTYDVHFESLGGNRIRASFFQGTLKKGEANGIVIVNSHAGQGGGISGPGASHAQGAGPDGRPAHMLGSFAFGPEYGFKQGAGKLDLVVGNEGANHILIGLLLPAVHPNPNVAAPGALKVREAASQPVK